MWRHFLITSSDRDSERLRNSRKWSNFIMSFQTVVDKECDTSDAPWHLATTNKDVEVQAATVTSSIAVQTEPVKVWWILFARNYFISFSLFQYTLYHPKNSPARYTIIVVWNQFYFTSDWSINEIIINLTSNNLIEIHLCLHNSSLLWNLRSKPQNSANCNVYWTIKKAYFQISAIDACEVLSQLFGTRIMIT